MDAFQETLVDELGNKTAFTIPLLGGIPVAESVVVSWIVMAVLVILALFIAKGFSGVVVYNALVVVVSLILPLPAALAISGVGTALCLSISYWMGRSTRTDSLEGLLSRHPKLNKYFTATQQYGFVFCFTIHMLGPNMELLGVLFGAVSLAGAQLPELLIYAGSVFWMLACAQQMLRRSV